MDNSLLVALRSYHPRPGRDPLEDFLTEAFVWTLKSHPGLAEAFLKRINSEAGLDGKVSPEVQWNTQEHVGSGIVDVVAETNSRTYLFEHKIWSKATAEQVDKYRRALSTDNLVTVLITGASWNYVGPQSDNVEEPDVRMTWAEVYTVLENWCEAGSGDVERAKDVLALLDHEGLGPREPLSEDRLRAYARASGVDGDLSRLMESIRDRFEDWSFAYGVLPDPEGRTRPEKRWKRFGEARNGRFCLSLYSKWEPGLLVGVLVDGSDLEVDFCEKEMGPDIVVMLGLPRKSLRDQYERVMRSSAYRELCTRLGEVEDWKVVARSCQEALKTNPWHPVLLQRPLAEVLRGKASDDQQLAVFQALKEGTELFLKEGELNALRERISEATS